MSAPLVVSEADIRPSLRKAIARSWNAVGKPGTNWSARDRVAFAQATIDAMAGDEVQGQSRTMAFIELLAADPGAVGKDEVQLALSESNEPSLVEVVSIVSRTAAVVSLYSALGLELPPMPRAQPGEPTRDNAPEEDWVDAGAWLPVTNSQSIYFAFSIVPEEFAEWVALTDEMYMSGEEMASPTIFNGISRAQHEVLASRTSYLNECFY